ncbi:ABC transporter permease [Pseudoxanthomonas spadix]|uniref:ABC transporter permease n=1 Tax=Pseudoxanthomonas spadix (strain BD-a59) TaxID=1045855 RepID=G7UVB6_PSEUP|nr:FtsX-like permease family protein [Pseudoxanthomonas spadix]AER57577.1 ABC transporter permease [Pseudoxanthomonas spadix BD-a59]MBP3973091.1 ABC transporter permease [Pseudoxanthomonas spadix]RMW97232.1 FtsX-like permease family protein [Pseudoxanthomonas spadix]
MEIRPILSTLRRHKTAAALIVVEIALACAIICNALFIVSQRWENLQETSGVAEHELVTVSLSGVGKQTNPDVITQEDLAALRAVPGVTNVAMVNQLPFRRGSNNSSLTIMPDQKIPTLSAAMYTGDEGTVRTLGLNVIAGRDFQPDEYLNWSELITQLNGNSNVPLRTMALIVSREAAQKLYPGQSAVGKPVYMANIPLTIVGVVQRLRRPNSFDGDTSYSMLMPLRQNYTNGGFYVLRVGDPAQRGRVLHDAVDALNRVDPNRLVMAQKTFDDWRSDYFSNDRDMMGLLITLCLALLLVTALGIIGLASFWVAQRTRQIGVRRALGATRGQILRYFQTENFLLVSAGIVLGMGLAYAINQLLMSRYELPRLPLVYLPVGAVLLWALGQIAVLWPARRAANVPPAIATRSA